MVMSSITLLPTLQTITIQAGLRHKYLEEGEIKMKIPRKLGTLLLAIWLILIGLSGFVSLGDLARIKE